jgi:hypothetical protein
VLRNLLRGGPDLRAPRVDEYFIAIQHATGLDRAIAEKILASGERIEHRLYAFWIETVSEGAVQ